MTDVLSDSYRAALSAMKVGGPKQLLSRAKLEAGERDPDADVSLAALVNFLQTASLNEPLRKELHLSLAIWDAEEADASWLDSTQPHTRERRRRTYAALDLDPPAQEAFDAHFPIASDDIIVISDTFEPWYDDPTRLDSNFYWPAYVDYLTGVRKWDVTSIASLDRATSQVVQRLSNPYRDEAYQAKGLVVGYVQSGKTANFTGVLAKAVDAGYRLLIVLTGTVDLLRAQTQRRIDMELVGRENILRGVDSNDPDLLGTVDYQDDPDWAGNRFVKHGILPSEQGLPDIVRLTTHRFDYKSLKAGITALEFERAVKVKPFYSPENLPTSSARLVIIKKNKTVLQKLVKDLKSITARLGEIPALIIDDESDQASVNTTNPKKWQSSKPDRTAINKLISELLSLLPRAQYVGYTATPFANVFIDPSDAEDIFPKDFLISLDRPPGYMGISDFHDLDSEIEPDEQTFENSHEKAHVRSLVSAPELREDQMLEALDAFLITGAVKLYREHLGQGPFRHHTMLFHESVRVADHAALSKEIRDIWSNAGYGSPTGLARLRGLYESDFQPVCQARPDGPLPGDFSGLKPYVGEVIARVTSLNNDPVIVVNGDKDIAQEPIDFDRRPVWRVLVGGTKLSRGFTVEGLTVSYYRRKTKQADTLMQMGRWFGFRQGYRDLVRLFIGREELHGKGTLDLYEAFEAIVRDEELFREQLRQYAKLVNGKPQVTPREIPPLVSQHLAWLKPAAPNKMFNAQLVIKRSPGFPIEPTAFPKSSSDLKNNFQAMRPLLQAAQEATSFLIDPGAAKSSSFEAYCGLVDHTELEEALSRLRWIVDEYFTPDLKFLNEIGANTKDWVVILPQTGAHGMSRLLPGIGNRSIFRRKRSRDPLFQAISDPKHRTPARRLAGVLEPYGDEKIEKLVAPNRGSILIYPIVEDELHPRTNTDEISPAELVIAFTVVAPVSAVGVTTPLVQFKARDSQNKDAIVVDA